MKIKTTRIGSECDTNMAVFTYGKFKRQSARGAESNHNTG